MAKLEKFVKAEWELTPERLAEFFCEMDGDEQAEFFNAVSEQAMEWGRPFCFQMQAIIDSQKINGGGLTIMKEIGEYGNAELCDAYNKAIPEGDNVGHECDLHSACAHPLTDLRAECVGGEEVA